MQKEAKDELISISLKVASILKDLKIWKSAVQELPTTLLQDLTHSVKQIQTLTAPVTLNDITTAAQNLGKIVQVIIKSFQSETDQQTFENTLRECAGTLVQLKNLVQSVPVLPESDPIPSDHISAIKTSSHDKQQDPSSNEQNSPREVEAETTVITSLSHEATSTTSSTPSSATASKRKTLVKKLSYTGGKKLTEKEKEKEEESVKKRSQSLGNNSKGVEEDKKTTTTFKIEGPSTPKKENNESKEPKERKLLRRKISYNKDKADTKIETPKKDKDLKKTSEIAKDKDKGKDKDKDKSKKQVQ